jgi:pilus assembly protein Flp/PilA
MKDTVGCGRLAARRGMAMEDGLMAAWRRLSAGFIQDRRAVTALEYGLIASVLAFVIIAIFTNLGTPLSSIFTNVGSKL